MKNTEEKILKQLQDEKIFRCAEILITCGAGTMLPKEFDHRRLIAMELADALAQPRAAGEWETEIGKLVMSGNIEKLQEQARKVFSENPICPGCGWMSRMKARRRTKDYSCTNCKYVVKL